MFVSNAPGISQSRALRRFLGQFSHSQKLAMGFPAEITACFSRSMHGVIPLHVLTRMMQHTGFSSNQPLSSTDHRAQCGKTCRQLTEPQTANSATPTISPQADVEPSGANRPSGPIPTGRRATSGTGCCRLSTRPSSDPGGILQNAHVSLQSALDQMRGETGSTLRPMGVH